MKPSDLPFVGKPVNEGHHDFFGTYTELADKRLLCIGFTEGEVEQYVASHGPASVTMLTNWVDHPDARITKFPLEFGDITKRTKFEDGRFDAILTFSVLEHLGDLHAGFAEMTRLVRHGGEFLHLFGPAWSCPYGHHIYEDPDDPNFNFSMWQMPAHMHLLCSPEEIEAYYRDLGYKPGTQAIAHHWFHETPLISRAFYDEYVQIMAGDEFQIDRMELMYNDLPNAHLQLLRRMYPGRHDFSTYGGRYRLIVRK